MKTSSKSIKVKKFTEKQNSHTRARAGHDTDNREREPGKARRETKQKMEHSIPKKMHTKSTLINQSKLMC